jgi:O-succinylbenzoate synthase
MNSFPDLTVVSIPTRTNFRGIRTREIALFRGSEGWSEFSPFLEYGKEEASTWLKAALEGANTPWPTLKRSSIAINATLPIVPVDQVQAILSRFEGCTTVKIKVDDFEGGSELVEETLNIIPNAKIRLDVNGSWSLEDALLHLYDFNLRFGKVFEQTYTRFLDLQKAEAQARESQIQLASKLLVYTHPLHLCSINLI